MMTARITRTLAALAVTAGLAVAGCGSDDEDTTTPAQQQDTAAVTAPGAAAVPADLLGTFERRITAADIARTEKIRDESGPNQEKPAPGPGLLVIDGTKLRFEDRQVKPPFAVEQSISATAERLSIEAYVRPDIGSFCGPEVPQNADYRWSREGAVLRLEAVGDPCADRDSTLTGDWTLKAG